MQGFGCSLPQKQTMPAAGLPHGTAAPAACVRVQQTACGEQHHASCGPSRVSGIRWCGILLLQTNLHGSGRMASQEVTLESQADKCERSQEPEGMSASPSNAASDTAIKTTLATNRQAAPISRHEAIMQSSRSRSTAVFHPPYAARHSFSSIERSATALVPIHMQRHLALTSAKPSSSRRRLSRPLQQLMRDSLTVHRRRPSLL